VSVSQHSSFSCALTRKLQRAICPSTSAYSLRGNENHGEQDSFSDHRIQILAAAGREQLHGSEDSYERSRPRNIPKVSANYHRRDEERRGISPGDGRALKATSCQAPRVKTLEECAADICWRVRLHPVAAPGVLHHFFVRGIGILVVLSDGTSSKTSCCLPDVDRARVDWLAVSYGSRLWLVVDGWRYVQKKS
jgi:hypothetical protein